MNLIEMPPNVPANMYAPLEGHLNQLKDLLDQLSVKLKAESGSANASIVPGLGIDGNAGIAPTSANSAIAANSSNVPKSANASSPNVLNSAYTFFGLTKNSKMNNLDKARRSKLKEYHANKHMQNSPENQEKFKELYSEIQPKYNQLKAVFEASSNVADAATNVASGNANTAAANTATQAILNAKKNTTLAIKNGNAKNVADAVASANVAASAANAAANSNNLGNNPLSAIQANALQPTKEKQDGGRSRKNRKNRKNHKTRRN